MLHTTTNVRSGFNRLMCVKEALYFLRGTNRVLKRYKAAFRFIKV